MKTLKTYNELFESNENDIFVNFEEEEIIVSQEDIKKAFDNFTSYKDSEYGKLLTELNEFFNNFLSDYEKNDVFSDTLRAEKYENIKIFVTDESFLIYNVSNSIYHNPHNPDNYEIVLESAYDYDEIEGDINIDFYEDLYSHDIHKLLAIIEKYEHITIEFMVEDLDEPDEDSFLPNDMMDYKYINNIPDMKEYLKKMKKLEFNL